MHHPWANKQRQHPRLLLDTGTDRSGQQHLLLWQQSSQEKWKYRMQQSAWLLQTRPSWPKSLFGPLPWQKEIKSFFMHSLKWERAKPLHLRSHKQQTRLGMPAVDDSLVRQQKRMTFSNGDLQHTRDAIYERRESARIVVLQTVWGQPEKKWIPDSSRSYCL